jgi:MFS family permease
MRLSLFRIRNVLVANLVGLVSGIIMFLLFFAVVYYAQYPKPVGLGENIISAGLTLAPSTLGMLIGGIVIGRILARVGPKPILLIGSAILGTGQVMFLFYRVNSTDLAADLFVALFGVICILVPLVNMLAISLPRDNVAVGLGINTMLRNLGGAIGPVVATTIMATYTFSVKVGPGPAITLPTSSAFDYIFYVGIALAVIAAAISLATKNYTFKKQTQAPPAAH